jgi:hypothetical protein
MSVNEVKGFVADTRSELAATLDEIEHRLSPAQLGKAATHWVSESYDRHPARWLIAGSVAVVGAVAAILWAIFSPED